jgi:hypothetical protein
MRAHIMGRTAYESIAGAMTTSTDHRSWPMSHAADRPLESHTPGRRCTDTSMERQRTHRSLTTLFGPATEPPGVDLNVVVQTGPRVGAFRQHGFGGAAVG